MLKAYFDDSGTHAESTVTVVGGLVGTEAQWMEFRQQWAEKLERPLPGKPRLKMFHLSACKAGTGEFVGYSVAERDAITHDFRQIIIAANLIGTASAVDRRAWDELVVGPLRAELGDALSPCSENAVSETIRIAGPHPDGDKIAIILDQGIDNPRLRLVAECTTRLLATHAWVRSITFDSVANTLPLQGADMMATEAYWHGVDWIQRGDSAEARAHFRHMLANLRCESVILGRREIEGALDEVRAELEQRDPRDEPVGWVS
jgi:hypothetical protein